MFDGPHFTAAADSSLDFFINEDGTLMFREVAEKAHERNRLENHTSVTLYWFNEDSGETAIKSSHGLFKESLKKSSGNGP